MAVNLELGNYHPPHLTEADDRMDASLGEGLGRQRLEKAVSGFYLPKIHDLVAPDSPVHNARALVERARGEGSGAALARAIVDRSADLVAAALAGTLASTKAMGRTVIAAEGSLFWSPGYADRCRATLERLSPHAFELRRSHDPNLTGAARAATAR
jgi:hexokinase